MDKRDIIILISAILLIMLLFSGFFKTTGFVIDNQKLLVSLDIPPDQQKIKAGQSLLIKTAIRVPGGNINQTSIVELEYQIRDSNGNLISSKKESGVIAVKESEITSLLIPSNTKPGVYTAFVSVNYTGDIYEASKTFEVTKNKDNLNLKIMAYLLIGLVIIVFLLIIIKKIKIRFITKSQ